MFGRFLVNNHLIFRMANSEEHLEETVKRRLEEDYTKLKKKEFN